MHFADRLHLSLWGNELFFKVVFEIIPGTVGGGNLSQGGGHAIAGPISGLRSGFEVSESGCNSLAFGIKAILIHVIVAGQRVPEGGSLIGGPVIRFWGIAHGSWGLVLLGHCCRWVRWIRSWRWRRCRWKWGRSGSWGLKCAAGESGYCGGLSFRHGRGRKETCWWNGRGGLGCSKNRTCL